MGGGHPAAFRQGGASTWQTNEKCLYFRHIKVRTRRQMGSKQGEAAQRLARLETKGRGLKTQKLRKREYPGFFPAER
jgi:hypothetical protein